MSAAGAETWAARWRVRRDEIPDPAPSFSHPDTMLSPARGVAALWGAVSQLADGQRPPESLPYGSPDLRRLRAERYRVFYTIDEERRVVQIDHVARLP